MSSSISSGSSSSISYGGGWLLYGSSERGSIAEDLLATDVYDISAVCYTVSSIFAPPIVQSQWESGQVFNAYYLSGYTRPVVVVHRRTL